MGRERGGVGEGVVKERGWGGTGREWGGKREGQGVGEG